MEAKHTKGPWYVDIDESDNWFQTRIFAGEGVLLANILEHIAEGRENARLMAAAPDLLRALELVALDLDVYSQCSKNGARIPEGSAERMLEVVREAIAKATGEQAP